MVSYLLILQRYFLSLLPCVLASVEIFFLKWKIILKVLNDTKINERAESISEVKRSVGREKKCPNRLYLVLELL